MASAVLETWLETWNNVHWSQKYHNPYFEDKKQHFKFNSMKVCVQLLLHVIVQERIFKKLRLVWPYGDFFRCLYNVYVKVPFFSWRRIYMRFLILWIINLTLKHSFNVISRFFEIGFLFQGTIIVMHCKVTEYSLKMYVYLSVLFCLVVQYTFVQIARGYNSSVRETMCRTFDRSGQITQY